MKLRMFDLVKLDNLNRIFMIDGNDSIFELLDNETFITNIFGYEEE